MDIEREEVVFNKFQIESSKKFFEGIKNLCLECDIFKVEVRFIPFSEKGGGDASGNKHVIVAELERTWPDPRCMTFEEFKNNPFFGHLYFTPQENQTTIINLNMDV